MDTPTHQPNDNQLAAKRGKNDAARTTASHEANVRLSRALPISRNRRAVVSRRSDVLEMQRKLGNAFVQRHLAAGHAVNPRPAPAGLQREGEAEPAAAAPGGPTSIGDGSTAVSAAGGIVKADGAIIELNAGMVRSAGVIQADTIIADSVVASSYTPGAGNVW
jgi:hypothetical protein